LIYDSTHHYEHTVARGTLIEATVEKLQLPRDLLNTWKRNYRLRLC